MAALDRPFDEVIATYERAVANGAGARRGTARGEPLLPRRREECRRSWNLPAAASI